MKTNYEQGAAAFAANNRIPSPGIPPVALVAVGNIDRFGEPVLQFTCPDGGIVDYTVNGAIDIRSGLATISKGSAAAMTLGAPSTGQNGTRLTIMANSAFAHVVTFTGATLFNGTAAKTTLTLTAFKGSCVTVIAVGGFWLLESNSTITSVA